MRKTQNLLSQNGKLRTENEKIIELSCGPTHQSHVSCTQKSIDFIKKNKTKPFFVYIPHSNATYPLFMYLMKFRDPNPQNAYINTIEHIDSEVGRLLDTLDELKLTGKTYVIYTTDNGPWLPFRHHGGSPAGPLREGKAILGGQRVPCVMRGPGIPAGTECGELIGTIDLLPTFAAITKSKLPKKNKIDGVNF